MRLAWIVAGSALVVLAVALATREGGGEHEVLELAGERSTMQVDLGVAPTLSKRADADSERASVDNAGVIQEDELPPVDPSSGATTELSLGRWLELPYHSAQDSEPEVTSPLPDAHELASFDGPLVRAEYEDGTLWFEAQRALNADGEWEREGYWLCRHSNGELHEQGEYRSDLAHGAWSWWYPDGNRMATGHFVNGERSGSWDWYFETGELAMQGSYAAGTGVATWTLYYPSGMRHAVGAFEKGEPSGPWTVWTEDGALDLARTGEYRDGEKIE